MIIVYGLTGVTILAVLIAASGILRAIWRREDRPYQAAHKTPRPWSRSAAGAARAGRRALRGTRRLPGAMRRKLTRDLPAEDRITLGLMQRMRAEDTGGLTYGVVGASGWPGQPDKNASDAAGLVGRRSGEVAAPGFAVAHVATPPVVHHDEYRPPQRWHEPVERVSLPPVTGPAITALAILAAPVAAHLAATAQAKAEEWDAYVRETRPWAEDTGSFAAICADVMDGA